MLKVLGVGTYFCLFYLLPKNIFIQCRLDLLALAIKDIVFAKFEVCSEHCFCY